MKTLFSPSISNCLVITAEDFFQFTSSTLLTSRNKCKIDVAFHICADLYINLLHENIMYNSLICIKVKTHFTNIWKME